MKYHTTQVCGKTCRPTNFNLVDEKFGIKYERFDNAQHLINTQKKQYEMEVDWYGSLNCGIWFDWNYCEDHVDIPMPTYVGNKIQEYAHPTPNNPQY